MPCVFNHEGHEEHVSHEGDEEHEACKITLTTSSVVRPPSEAIARVARANARDGPAPSGPGATRRVDGRKLISEIVVPFVIFVAQIFVVTSFQRANGNQ
jgi:hypothetical protein